MVEESYKDRETDSYKHYRRKMLLLTVQLVFFFPSNWSLRQENEQVEPEMISPLGGNASSREMGTIGRRRSCDDNSIGIICLHENQTSYPLPQHDSLCGLAVRGGMGREA